jgi:hypothetical protein
MIALATHLAQIGELPIGQPLRIRLRTIEEARDARRGQKSVVLGLERGALLTAQVGARARHHHRRVPAQERQSAAKSVQAFELLFELFVGRGRHDLSAPIPLQDPATREYR